MSDSEETDRELSGRVINVSHYDPDSSEEEIDDFDDLCLEDNYSSADEDTEDGCDLLSDLLSEVAKVSVIGKKAYKIDFYEKNIDNFENRDSNVDFDVGEDGYPILPEGGESFIAPFLKNLSKKEHCYKKCSFETNQKIKIEL